MNHKCSNIIKETNLDTLRRALRAAKTATKSELATLSGLSVVTVNSLMKTLLDAGEVFEEAPEAAPLGRPAATYKFNAEHSLALVIFMHEKESEDRAFFTVCNLYGQELVRIESHFSEIELGSFDETIGRLLLKYPQIRVIGFGMPEADLNGKLIGCDYPKLVNTEFTAYFESKFRLPVFIENDINAATAGYYNQNYPQQELCLVGLYFPSKYPPGAGIFSSHHLIKGKNGLAGEIKYLPFAPDYNSFDYDEGRTNEFITKTIKAFMCTLNPDVFVVFKENASESYCAELEADCPSDIEKLMLPQIFVSDEINKYFEAGLISLALERIL